MYDLILTRCCHSIFVEQVDVGGTTELLNFSENGPTAVLAIPDCAKPIKNSLVLLYNTF